MDNQLKMRAQIAELVELRKESWRLSSQTEQTDSGLGPPCTQAEIETVTRAFGRPLPPTYRTFLELHNSWRDFAADAALLSAEDRSEPWVHRNLENLSDLFDEFEKYNPLKGGAFVLMLGKTSPVSLFLDARKPQLDGEYDLLLFDWTQRQKRFASFSAFLADEIRREKHYVKALRK